MSETSPTLHISTTLATEVDLAADLPTPTQADLPDPGAPDGGLPVGSLIGHFRVLRMVGAGGMGIVYLAEQTAPIVRRVAIKVGRSLLSRPADRVRFLAEQQAMAHLHHPNVAQLFESGTTGAGRPYFAMEWLEGDTIDAYCDRRALPLRARLALFADVCRGVHHAHQKGMVHRDLKPSNVLVIEVDGRPVPKIIDFGIVKPLDQPQDAATRGAVLGTPSYVSPEALDGEGDLDTRADVYALGLVLYALLAGSHPYEDARTSLGALLQRIARDPLPGPLQHFAGLDGAQREKVAARRGTTVRGLERALRQDLEWIVLQATAKDRERRYETVAELRADLLRHLAYEPVQAGFPGPWYRLRRLLRRRRGLLAAATLSLASLVGATAATTLEARRARQAETEARQFATFMADLFSEANPWNDATAGMTARDLLHHGARKLQADTETAAPVRARLLSEIGIALMHMGDTEAAAPLLAGALDLRRQHYGPRALEVASTLIELGVCRHKRGRRPRSAKPCPSRKGTTPRSSSPRPWPTWRTCGAGRAAWTRRGTCWRGRFRCGRRRRARRGAGW